MNYVLPLRHTIPAVIFTAGLVIVIAAYLIDRDALNRNMQHLAEQQLRSTATYIAAELERSLRSNDIGSARATIDRVAATREITLVVLAGPEGAVRYANDPTLIGKSLQNHQRTAHLDEMFEGSDDSLQATIRLQDTIGIAAGSFPVQMRGVEQDFLPREFGKLYIIYDISAQARQQHIELLQRMIPRATFLALLTILFWAFFRRVLLHRLNLLVASVRAVAKGDFSNEPDIKGNDELAELGAELTVMMRQLRTHREQVAFLADHDQLTGLLNRHGFETEVERAMRYPRRKHVVCLLDIDSLRVVNDTRGHMVGDELLRAFAHFLSEGLDGVVAVARVGGDEFALLLQIADPANMENAAISLQTAIREFRYTHGDDRFSVQVSIGLVLLGADIKNPEDALGLADTACYAAKEIGHGRYAIWESNAEEWSQKHGQMRWVSRIQHALDENRFRLYAQTIKPLSPTEGQGVHIEILVRMLDEDGKLVPPGDFLGAAERYNLVGKIDRWVIHETLDWLESNPASRQAIDMCAINLSGLSFGDKELLDEISKALSHSTSVRPGKLCFEVTETSAITNLGHAREFINSLRGMGCSFALDDFGSGVSSFGYLKNLPVDYIKIDGMFVRDIIDDSTDRAIVSSINSIAHEMGMRTIAEFAETKEIIELLRKLGIDYAQGYGVSRPEPLEDVVGALALAKRKHA